MAKRRDYAYRALYDLTEPEYLCRLYRMPKGNHVDRQLEKRIADEFEPEGYILLEPIGPIDVPSLADVYEELALQIQTVIPGKSLSHTPGKAEWAAREREVQRIVRAARKRLEQS